MSSLRVLVLHSGLLNPKILLFIAKELPNLHFLDFRHPWSRFPRHLHSNRFKVPYPIPAGPRAQSFPILDFFLLEINPKVCLGLDKTIFQSFGLDHHLHFLSMGLYGSHTSGAMKMTGEIVRCAAPRLCLPPLDNPSLDCGPFTSISTNVIFLL